MEWGITRDFYLWKIGFSAGILAGKSIPGTVYVRYKERT